jgi:galactose mutarotase-like enzyme
VPDRNGQMADIVLGHSTLEPYLDHKTNPYFGSIVGRYANRIAKGKFTLDGQQYTLDASSGGNHLHGGKTGFDLKVWKAEPMPDNPEGPALRLTYSSPRRRGGLPRPARHHGRLHADARQRPEDRIPGEDRQADGGEPDQPCLLQPLGRGVG